MNDLRDVYYPPSDALDDMPPLVDNPLPMMYTFATNMTPLAYGSSPASLAALPDAATTTTTTPSVFDDDDDALPPPPLSTPPDSPLLSPARPSHAKRRDAAHIPRPPNAFILFRSSFVRAQRVPGRTEGNHSTLSKIVGMCWRNLAPAERAVWERKALLAQAEHRRRYPDWRFRPANAHALAKVKDGPPPPPADRRRHRGQGRGESEAELRSREKRCVKIADLLGEGMTGPELAAAVEAYDRAAVEEGPRAAQTQTQTETQTEREAETEVRAGQVVKLEPEKPGVLPDMAFKVPLTAMSKRSSSAPAAPGRLPVLGLASTLDSPFAAFGRPVVKGLLTDAPEGSADAVEGAVAEAQLALTDDVRARVLAPSHTPHDAPPPPRQSLAMAFPQASCCEPLFPGLEFASDYHYTAAAEGAYASYRPYALGPAVEGAYAHARKQDDAVARVSSYSSLKGWAGAGGSARCSPQAPPASLADTSVIMNAAFAAAASTLVPREDTDADADGFGAAAAAATFDPATELCLHEYARGKRLMNILDLQTAPDAAAAGLSYMYEHDIDHSDYI